MFYREIGWRKENSRRVGKEEGWWRRKKEISWRREKKIGRIKKKRGRREKIDRIICIKNEILKRI